MFAWLTFGYAGLQPWSKAEYLMNKLGSCLPGRKSEESDTRLIPIDTEKPLTGTETANRLAGTSLDEANNTGTNLTETQP